ncbi:MAG: hypothetical protein KDH19_00955 [Geminicoccaceae bacterium]|nr:hypothetical protein [Geminicoccaceae bacterium]
MTMDLGIPTLTGDDLRRAAAFWQPDLGEYLGSAVESGLADSIPGTLLREADMPARSPMSAEGAFAQSVRTDEQRRRIREAHDEKPELRAMSEREWRASPWYRSDLEFDPFMTEARAEARAGVRDERRWRDHIATARDPNMAESVLSFGAEVVGGLPDPLNFAPLIGPAWKAAWVAKAATRKAYLLRSAAIGAAEGAAGTALAMPLTLPSRQYVGDQTGMAEIMLELAIGAAAPAALSGAGGWWHTRGGRSWRLDLDPSGESVTARPVDVDEMIAESGGERPAPLDPAKTGRKFEDIKATAVSIAKGEPVDTRGMAEPESQTLGDRLRREPLDGPRWVRTADNQRFLADDSGNADLGTAPRIEAGAAAGEDLPVRLRRREIKHLDDKLHRQNARDLGYEGGVELTLDVVDGWTEIRASYDGRVLLVKQTGSRSSPVAAVELAKVDGTDYWRVVTSGVRSSDQLGKVLGTRAPTPDSASGQQNSFHRGAGSTGDAPGLAQSPQAPHHDIPSGGDQGPDAVNRSGAPDDAPPIIDHPAAFPDDDPATMRPDGPEPDHIGDAVKRAKGTGDARHDAPSDAPRSAGDAPALDPDPDVAAFQMALDAGKIRAGDAAAFAAADAELSRMARLGEAYEQAAACVLRGLAGGSASVGGRAGK